MAHRQTKSWKVQISCDHATHIKYIYQIMKIIRVVSLLEKAETSSHTISAETFPLSHLLSSIKSG